MEVVCKAMCHLVNVQHPAIVDFTRGDSQVLFSRELFAHLVKYWLAEIDKAGLTSLSSPPPSTKTLSASLTFAATQGVASLPELVPIFSHRLRAILKPGGSGIGMRRWRIPPPFTPTHTFPPHTQPTQPELRGLALQSNASPAS